MSSPEWILAVGRLKLFLYLEESPGLGLVVDPVEAGKAAREMCSSYPRLAD